MSFVYRFLGIVARVNQTLNRYRVNFIPLSFGLTLFLGVAFLGSLFSARAGLEFNPKPAVRTVAEAIQHKNDKSGYVTVKGALDSETGFQESSVDKNSNKTLSVTYYDAILDTKERAVLFVKRAGGENEVNKESKKSTGGANPDSEQKPVPTQITGMLTSAGSDVQTELRKFATSSKGDPITVETEYILEEGEKPVDPVITLVWMGISGPLFLAFILTWVWHYVVFEKAGEQSATVNIATSVPEQGIDLRVSGRFSLDGKTTKRFLNVPSFIAPLETGEMALLSNIDASTRFMGITTGKQAGIWAIVLAQNGLHGMELGNLYDGTAVRPAIRIRFQAGSGSETAVLSFATSTQREFVLAELNRYAGYNAVRS